MRRPSRRISPPAMRPGGSSRPMMALPVSDLPAPDSPTTPSTSPGAMSNETSSTASRVPRRVGNSTRRFLTSSSGGLLDDGRLADPQRSFGIEGVAQPVAQQVDRQHQGGQRDAGEDRDPPVARQQDLVAEADQRAERGLGRRQADAEERQRRLGDDGEAEIDGGDHQHRAGDVGQHVADHDQHRRQADHARRLDVFLVLLDHAPSRARCGRTAPRSESPMAPTMT